MARIFKGVRKISEKKYKEMKEAKTLDPDVMYVTDTVVPTFKLTKLEDGSYSLSITTPTEA